MTDLISLEKFKNPTDLFCNEGERMIEFLLSEKLAEAPTSIKTKDDRKAVASFAYAISKCKTHIDDIGKKAFFEERKKIKALDASRKRIVEFLDNAKKDYRYDLTFFERAEAATLAAHERMMNGEDEPEAVKNVSADALRNFLKIYIKKENLSFETMKKKVIEMMKEIYESE